MNKVEEAWNKRYRVLASQEPKKRRVRRKVRQIRVEYLNPENGWNEIVTEKCPRMTCNRCPARFKCWTHRDDLILTAEEWKQVDTTNGTGRTLLQWKNLILNELPYVDVKEYSHNIITLSLRSVASGWGEKTANKIVREFGLDKLGWGEE